MKFESLVKAILFVSISCVFLTNCKKGPDDPAVSLRSRKARVTGNWRLEGGNVSLTYNPSGKSPYSQYFVFKTGQFEMTETYQGGIPTIYIGDYTLNLNFIKDGKFDLTETISRRTTRVSGTWNFVAGVGKTKNKESIVLKIDAASAGASNDCFFTKFNTELTYQIKELRNKRIVLTASCPLYTGSDGNTKYGSNYSLIQ